MAAPKDFTGTLSIRLGVGPFSSDTPGSGMGTSDGGFGSPATIGSGVFPVHTTFTGTPPFLGVVSALEFAAPGSPGVPGGNGPLNWNGSTGTMPLSVSAFLRGLGTTLGALPLNVVGVGGTQPFAIGGLTGSVVANPFQLGSFWLTGTLTGSFLTVFASGFDNRTSNGFGQLQMVSPTYINFAGLGTLPAAAILSLNFQPPPPGNDDFADANPVSALPYSEATTTSGATRETNEPTASCDFSSTGGTLWWAFTASDTQTVSARAPAQFFSTYTAVYTGTSLSNLSEVACERFSDLASFVADAGQTYFVQVAGLFGDSGQLQFQIDVAPPPVADFFSYPSQPSKFEPVTFYGDYSDDPAGIGIETYFWDFGDGTTFEPDCCPQHLYGADGDYTVELTVTTFDGRSASTSRILSVETHDVAITKFSLPGAASAGQTRTITVGVNNRLYPEEVEVELYRSRPGGGWDQIGRLVQSVPVRQGNRTTSFPFSYTFTEEDGAVGKVTFRATAWIRDNPDALPADNEAISGPTKVR